MTVTLVCDPSEAMELCASQQLYLKPVARLTISVVFPEHTGSTRTFSKWEVMDKLKNMICPDQFTSVKVAKSTKGFIRFEGEAETKRLVCSLKEKLHGKMIKLNGFKDDLQVVATEASSEIPVSQGLEPLLNNRELLEENFADQSQENPNCIHLEGLPCKWFAVKGSESEAPSEDVLRSVFGSFGEIKNVDIPMLDPYREETVGGGSNNFTFRGLRTFEAFVQYQEPASFSKAMETLRGMKLMFKGDDGKALACNIKVTPDATNHFSESSINQRNLERLTLQGLERERKREENRGKKATERKRRDDDDGEKKGGEGKRKSKIKRREKRQIDRDEKRPRKQQKVTTGEELWPENMPEWEERKYLLAQRRVESIRLLTVLLNQIKNFVLSSRQIGEPLLNLECERENCFPPHPMQNSLKEPTSPCYLEYRELRDERARSTQLDETHIREYEEEEVEEEEEEEEHCVVTGLPLSPRPLVRTVLNEPLPRAITSLITDNGADCFRACGLLQVTVTQDCRTERPSGRADDQGPNLGHFFKASSPPGKCKKQKVYETEEFIHYLLNYYQTPRYARICPGSQSPSDDSWWHRVVSCNGSGFQVSLENRDGQSLAEEGVVSDPDERDSRGGEIWEVLEEESEPAEVMPKKQAHEREFTSNYGARHQESVRELSDQMTPEEGDLSPGLVSHSTTGGRRPQAECLGAVIRPSQRAFGHVHKLKDLLEEISSDSEYFSESVNESRSKTERRNGGCRSGCKTCSLGPQKATELLICVQNVAQGEQGGEYSKRSFCSNSGCCDSTKRPRQRLKTMFKRSSSKVRHEGQKVKWVSSEDEREDIRKKKKKKRSSSRSLSDDKPYLLKANRGGELESLSKLQRKYSKMFHHKMKCKTLHTMAGAAKAKDAVHLSNSQLQDSQQEAGDLFLRREVEGEPEGWPLFPVEIIQTNPYSESVCGTELERGC